ncbi:MAG: O-antigen ligase family protein [Planctomycetes bacterium]|nr:O-antigen ligase family protein [Planctomycetota bacterium]
MRPDKSVRLPASQITFGVICLCLGVLPAWFYGGAHWATQFWLILVGFLVGLGWWGLQLKEKSAIPISRKLQAILFIALLCTVWTVLQTVPVPSWARILPVFQGSQLKTVYLVEHDSLPNTNISDSREVNAKRLAEPSYRTWASSMDPIHSLAAIGSFALIVIVVLCSYRFIGSSSSLIYLTLLLLMCNATLISLLGIIEKVSPGDWTLLEMKVSNSFATFVSRSSAAAFLNVGLAAAVGCFALQSRLDHAYRVNPTYRSTQTTVLGRIRAQFEEAIIEISTPKAIILICSVIIFVGILISLSRAGTICSIAAMVSLFSIHLFRKHFFVSVGMLAILLFLSFAALQYLDKLDTVRTRLESLSGENLTVDAGRLTAWNSALSAAGDVWLGGGGLGNFHYTYLPFQNRPMETWFYHAESMFLQALVDLGILGLLSFVFLGGVTVYLTKQLLAPTKNSTCRAIGSALLFIVISLGLHSLIDFSLILPGIYLPIAILIGIGLAVENDSPSLTKSSRKKSSRKYTSSNTDETEKRYIPSFVLLLPCLTFAIAFAAIRPKVSSESFSHLLEQWSEKHEDSTKNLLAIIREGETQLKTFTNEGELNISMAKAYTQLYRVTMRDQKQMAWEDTLPLYARDSFYKRNRIENLNVDELLQNPTASDALKKARLCWLRAHYALPLDWRPHWGLVELDFVDTDNSNSAAHLDHLRVLARNRPELLMTASIASLDYPGPDSAFTMLKQVAGDYTLKAPAVLKVAYRAFGDRALSEEFVPPQASIMLYLAESLPSINASPDSLKIFWNTIYQHLQKLPNQDRNKSTLLAYYYHETGDIENEYLTLLEAVNRSPMNTYTRYLLAKNLILRKELDKAEVHIEFCLRQEPAKKEFLQLRDELTRERVPLPEIKP